MSLSRLSGMVPCSPLEHYSLDARSIREEFSTLLVAFLATKRGGGVGVILVISLLCVNLWLALTSLFA